MPLSNRDCIKFGDVKKLSKNTHKSVLETFSQLENHSFTKTEFGGNFSAKIQINLVNISGQTSSPNPKLKNVVNPLAER